MKNLQSLITILALIVTLGLGHLAIAQAQETKLVYRCMAQCFVLDFNQGAAQSFGQVQAESKLRSDAFQLATQRCGKRARSEGISPRDAFLVTSIQSSHAVHDASSRNVYDSNLSSSFASGSALVIKSKRFFRASALGFASASEAHSNAHARVETSTREHDEKHDLKAEFARPDLNCEVYERDSGETPMYGGELDVQG